MKAYMQPELAQKLSDSVQTLREGDIIDAKVLAVENNALYLDIGPRKTGIVYGVESSKTLKMS